MKVSLTETTPEPVQSARTPEFGANKKAEDIEKVAEDMENAVHPSSDSSEDTVPES